MLGEVSKLLKSYSKRYWSCDLSIFLHCVKIDTLRVVCTSSESQKTHLRVRFFCGGSMLSLNPLPWRSSSKCHPRHFFMSKKTKNEPKNTCFSSKCGLKSIDLDRKHKIYFVNSRNCSTSRAPTRCASHLESTFAPCGAYAKAGYFFWEYGLSSLHL